MDLVRLVVRGARAQPDGTALVAAAEGGYTATFRELLTAAHLLRTEVLAPAGVVDGATVGLHVPRCPEALVAVLAVHAAGAAYVPLEPTLPRERKQDMLALAACVVVLTPPPAHESDATRDPLVPGTAAGPPPHLPLPALAGTLQRIRREHGTAAATTVPAWDDVLRAFDASPTTPDHRCCVLFTSGSTGKPKGVDLRHRGHANYVEQSAVEFPLAGATDRVLWSSRLLFDVSVLEIFWPWACGTAVVVPQNDIVLTPAQLAACIVRHGVTAVQFVPTVLRQLFETAATLPDKLVAMRGQLRYVFSCGEPLPLSVRRLVVVDSLPSPATRVVNLYGPTETSVQITFWDCRGPGETIKVGRPFANVHVVLRDPEDLARSVEGRAFTADHPAHVCVEGIQLAAGYLHDPVATGKAFVTDAATGARLYCTGDLGYWDGTDLVLLGRIDNQVKVDGNRVDIDGIQYTLEQHGQVGQAVVVPVVAAAALPDTPPAGAQLVAFLQPRTGVAPAAVDLAAVRARAAAYLPAAAVPRRWLVLERFPLTASGKVDRKALVAQHAASATTVEHALHHAAAHAHATAGAAAEAAGAPAASAPAPVTDPLQRELLDLCRSIDATFAVGPQDHLVAEFGFASLPVMRLLGLMAQRYGTLDLTYQEVLANDTLEQLAGLVRKYAATLESRPADAAPSAAAASEAHAIASGAPFALARTQERILFIQQLMPAQPLYNIPMSYTITGSLDVPRLRRAAEAVYGARASLRTVVTTSASSITQRILTPAELPLYWESLDFAASPNAFQAGASAATAFARHNFNLARDPQLRVQVAALGPQQWRVTFVFHHLACDGWTMGLFLRELEAAYTDPAAWAAAPPPERPFAEYVAIERQQMGDPTSKARQYWRQQLQGELPLLDIPTDFPRPAQRLHTGNAVFFELDDDLAASVRALCRREGASLFEVALAAYAFVLLRMSGQRDIVLGTPIASRPVGFDATYGFFANTLPLRLDELDTLDRAVTVRQLLRRVSDKVRSAFDHRDVAFDDLVQEFSGGTRTGLFQAMIVVQNNHSWDLTLPAASAAAPLQTAWCDVATLTSKFEFVFQLISPASVRSGPIPAYLEYSDELFDRSTAERIADYLVQAFRAFASAPDGSTVLYDVDLLGAAGATDLLARTAPRLRPRPAGPTATVLHAFLDRARLEPGALAAVDWTGAEVTYARLFAAVRDMAALLRASAPADGAPDAPVAVLFHPGWRFLPALLAAMAVGRPYYAVDPGLPDDRVRATTSDAGCCLLVVPPALTAERTASLAAAVGLPLVPTPAWETTETAAETVDAAVDAFVADAVRTTDLCYIVYTSGSTGKPKGMRVPHSALLNYVLCFKDAFAETERMRMLQGTSVAFDVHPFEIFLPLAAGGSVHFCQDERDVRAVLHAVQHQRISDIFMVPSVLAQAIDERLVTGAMLQSLRRLHIGGEAVDSVLVGKIVGIHPALTIVNMYGPAEAPFCSFERIHVPGAAASASGRLQTSIGRPIDNAHYVILEENQAKLCCVGARGELVIGGHGLTARDYIALPETTRERFIEHPLLPGMVLYRTGDIVRLMTDDRLEYCGRRDRQRKVNGARVELGEIEAVIRKDDSVGGVLADVITVNRTKRVIAVVIPATANVARIRQLCTASLPSFARPFRVAVLPAFPRLLTGKIDVNATLRTATADLAAEAGSGTGQQGTRRAPRHALEAFVAQAYATALQCRVEDLAYDVAFFEMGGTSISVVPLVWAVEQRTGATIALLQFFQNSPLGDFVNLLVDVLHVDPTLPPALAKVAA